MCPENQDDPPKVYRVLTLDGGGAKGFYTLGILAEMESLTKHPLCECFDLIVGTSTGAIIAALLARGEKVEGVRALYEKHVPVIMRDQSGHDRTQALKTEARAVFPNQTCEIFKTAIEIVATNWRDKRPIIFKNLINYAYKGKASFDPFFGVSVADAVIASCSAYPFFDPHTITKRNGDVVICADGGFCANNPTLYALADATVALGYPRANIRLISLGVGSYPEPKLWRKARRFLRDWRLAQHACSSAFLQKMLDTNTLSMEVIAGLLFKDLPTVRIHDSFTEPDMATDLLEHDLKKLNRLVQKGRDSFRAKEEQIQKFLLED